MDLKPTCARPRNYTVEIYNLWKYGLAKEVNESARNWLIADALKVRFRTTGKYRVNDEVGEFYAVSVRGNGTGYWVLTYRIVNRGERDTCKHLASRVIGTYAGERTVRSVDCRNRAEAIRLGIRKNVRVSNGTWMTYRMVTTVRYGCGKLPSATRSVANGSLARWW